MKVAVSYKTVKNTIIHLYLASVNGSLAIHIFGNMINKDEKKVIKPSGSSISKLSTSLSSKDTRFFYMMKTSHSCTQYCHHIANKSGYSKYFKLRSLISHPLRMTEKVKSHISLGIFQIPNSELEDLLH
jgi:hypothetical protein